MWQAPFWERVVDVRLRRPRPIGFADKYGNAAKRTAVNFSYQPKTALHCSRGVNNQEAIDLSVTTASAIKMALQMSAFFQFL